MRARAARATLVAALIASAVVAFGGPARADLRPGFTLKPGDKITKTYPAPPPWPEGFRNNNNTPSSCNSRPTCDHYPLTLDIPKSSLGTHSYLLTVTVAWDPGTVPAQTIPATGTQQQNSMSVFLWSNPPKLDSAGNPTFDASDNGLAGSDPAVLTEPAPATTQLDLTVQTFTGAGYTYTLTLDFQDLTAAPIADLSVDQPPVDYSAPTAIPIAALPTAAAYPISPVGPYSAPAVLPAAPVTKPLDLLPVTADALDSLKVVDDGPQLGVAPAQNASAIRRQGPPAAHSASTLAMLFWLVVVPLAVIAGAGGWLQRRRAARFTAT